MHQLHFLKRNLEKWSNGPDGVQISPSITDKNPIKLGSNDLTWKENRIFVVSLE